MASPHSDIELFLRQLTLSCVDGELTNFDDALARLGKLVADTSGENGRIMRKELSANKSVWDATCQFLEFGSKSDEKRRASEEFTRLYRGIILLLRNLVVESTLDSDDCFELFLSIAANYHFADSIKSSAFYLPTVLAFVELLVNSCRSMIRHPSQVASLLGLMFERHWLALCFHQRAVIILLKQIIVDGSDTADETNHNLLLRHIIKENGHIMNYIVDVFSKMNDGNGLSHQDQHYIDLMVQVLSHESFEKFLMRQSRRQISEWLKVAQVVIPYKSDWNNFQLTAILCWSLECLNLCVDEINEAFNAGVTADFESMVICSLDCISELAKFEQGVKFMHHYNFLDLVIKLFGALQLHVKPSTIKEKAPAGVGNFPHAKNMLVETISCICHGQSTQQDMMRELHGLELVLSNCIIDDNNPFLRERCIVCIKILLADNPENQKVVARLEAKGAAEDNVLSQAGYEVELVDGKVAVKKKSQADS